MIDYNQYYTETLSNSEMYDRRERASIEEMANNVAITGGILGAGIYGYNVAKRDPRVLEMVQKLPGAGLLQQRLEEARGGIDPTPAPGPQPLSKSLHSMLLAAEEASPLHIAKTLGLSSFQTLFVEIVDQEKQPVKIGSESIRAYSAYYKNLILNSSGYELTRQDIKNGFILQDSKLYLANRDGSLGREIAGYARIINTNVHIGHQDSPNRVFQKFANIHGVDVHMSQFKAEPLAIVAGRDKQSVIRDWTRAYSRFIPEIGFKVLDNPLGFIEDMAGNMGVDTRNSKLFNNRVFKAMSKHFNISLGANGVYNQGNRAALLAMSKNLGIKAIGAYTSYVSINHLLEKMTGEDNPWHNGIAAGVANLYAKARIGMARIWSDNLQPIREEQEQAAPESTSLMTLAAFPMGGAMLGANIAYFQRMRDTYRLGFDASAKLHTDPRKFTGIVGQILDKVNLNPQGTTLARYGKLGALAGAALTLPFLPGALVGRSSQELYDEYSGKSDVAVRRNRGWLMNGDAYEGGQIKYHRKSLIREAITDARNKTLYEDGDQQRDMDPLASPFEYLKNPYAFEEAHQHDMPYPVWGMDVTYGSFLGKIFQGTIGQLIKPTVVNPAMQEYAKGIGTRAEQLAVPVRETKVDTSLQDDGMLLAQQSATVNPTTEAMVGAYAAFSDFTGLKGFTAGLALDALGLDPAEQTAPKLAVSGSANTLVDRYQSLQLGDALGCFIKGTLVGDTPIEDIQVGDKVLSKGWVERVVSKVYQKEYEGEVLKVTLGDTYFICTPDHVFPGMRDERPISDWEVGECLIGRSGSLCIVSKEVLWYKGTIYDLEVSESDSTACEDTHYYTVNGVLCHNSGEFIRRLVPQSADTRREEVNPMRNTIGDNIDWLPKDPNGRDFGSGNYFDNVPDIGYTMLPGSRGFEALHPELKGIDPNDYSDAWKYRILQNVARGSKEHYLYRDRLIKNIDNLSDYDKNIFFTAYEQDMARGEEKKFFEYADEKEKSRMNLYQLLQNTLWESVSHLESPTEPLTPFRPMAKFLHQRTAIEDYRRTQLAGSDAAIWTKPLDHFINPTINRSLHILDPYYKPNSVSEKEAIDEYFDNLKLVKSAEGRPFDAKNTLVSAAYSGMRTRDDMLAFKRALPDNQKAYVTSFANERDETKRAQILEMLPENVGRVYKSIWGNIDAYESSGEEGVRKRYLDETKELERETGITLTRQEIEGINKASYKIRDREERERYLEEERAAKLRAKIAQQEARAYIEETVSPSASWIGWDRRLTIDDIKLKTLSVGNEDITRFGYWSREKNRNDRLVALNSDTEVVQNLDEIKKHLRDTQDKKHMLKRRLEREGYEVRDISTTPGGGRVDINSG